MVYARVRAIMHSLTLMYYRYVHVHNHGQGSHRPGKVLEFDLGPGKLLEFQNSAICPGIVLEFYKIALEM